MLTGQASGELGEHFGLAFPGERRLDHFRGEEVGDLHADCSGLIGIYVGARRGDQLSQRIVKSSAVMMMRLRSLRPRPAPPAWKALSFSCPSLFQRAS